MALVLLICTGIGSPFSYLSKTFKDVEHYCLGCERKLVTVYTLSGAEIHVF